MTNARSSCRHRARTALSIAIIALGAGGQANQARPGSASIQHEPHVRVEPDRVRIGEHEFVPRFLDLDNVVQVPAGASATLSPPGPHGGYDYIEVAGILYVPAMTVRVTTLTVLPGGRLEVACGAEIVGRDEPLDTSRDPFQWGNGLLNFGTKILRCARKTPFVELAADDVPAGATTLELAEVPDGWTAGDELLLPDMRQVTARAQPRREQGTRIAAIDGLTITLNAPLAFAREAVRRPDGSVVLRPRVANLTRETVIRSENPAGMRWHTANIGTRAAWDVQAVAFIGLGRTRVEPLDSTTNDRSHVGSNQIGRYADHDHHGGSSLAERRSVGNAYLGLGGGKWAKVVHATHHTLVEDNVCVDTPGSCFITEDGSESHNVFRRNVSAYTSGNGNRPVPNVSGGCPGCESGQWYQGVKNTFVENESWNDFTGINVFNRSRLKTRIPSLPGGPADQPFDAAQAVPIVFRDNVTLGARTMGLEVWDIPEYFMANHVAAHSGQAQVFARSGHLFLRDFTVIANNGQSLGVDSSQGYTGFFGMEGGEIRGARVGLSSGMARFSAVVRGTTLQNTTNVAFGNGIPYDTVFDDVVHETYGTAGPDFMRFQPTPVWEPGQPFPVLRGGIYWDRYRGSPVTIRNWQGTGQDYILLSPAQQRSHAAWPSSGTLTYVPEAGLTMGEAWDKYGMALGGDVLSDGAGIRLEGVTSMLARPGLERPLGPPRAIMVSPSLLAPAAPVDGKLTMIFVLTGRFDVASDAAVFAIDGGRPVRVTGRSNPGDARRYTTTAVGPGTHDVVTWRESPDGSVVPGSRMTFQYFVHQQ